MKRAACKVCCEDFKARKSARATRNVWVTGLPRGWPATAIEKKEPCFRRMYSTSSPACANPSAVASHLPLDEGRGSPRRTKMLRMPAWAASASRSSAVSRVIPVQVMCICTRADTRKSTRKAYPTRVRRTCQSRAQHERKAYPARARRTCQSRAQHERTHSQHACGRETAMPVYSPARREHKSPVQLPESQKTYSQVL